MSLWCGCGVTYVRHYSKKQKQKHCTASKATAEGKVTWGLSSRNGKKKGGVCKVASLLAGFFFTIKATFLVLDRRGVGERTVFGMRLSIAEVW